MEDREDMIVEACRRLNASTRRGPNAYKRIVDKLLEIGGIYRGPRDEFLVQVGTPINTHLEPLRILISNGIINSPGKGSHNYWIEFSDEGLKAYLSGPEKCVLPKHLRTNKRCPQCGSKAFQVVGEVCVGCYSRNVINRDRNGYLKV